jgi:Holliday junction DNA helicase RuvA
MITYLHGTLAEKHPTRIVVDVGGVGYEVFIPLSSYDRLPNEKGAIRVLIHDHLREDCHLLFGFITEPERQMFLMLTDVSGIGPKLAMSALSGLTVRELKAAIAQSDVKRLSSISGIGKKTAERIVVELRDRLSKADALEAGSGASHDTPEDTKVRDAVLALVALGFKQEQARDRVLHVMRNHPQAATASIEELVKHALAQGPSAG